ncbi:MAG: hypothetical protein LBN21_10500 [Treponema sp.]|nr:hypothetical protein [Treponema sp.]
MSTIPIIFNETLPSYTAVGGKERLASTGLSAVLLNRGARYPRRNLFQELEKTGFDYVISLETSHERYDVEELSGRFPFVRFILLKEEVSPGEMINLAASELTGSLFFVIWNDLHQVAGGTAARMAERLCLSAEDQKNAGGNKSPFKRLCTVPTIQNARFEVLPTLVAPVVMKKNVKTLLFPPIREGLPSLYPFDGVGIYDRERFIRLGGFDRSIKNNHWQFMDFGFRSWLWGEEISSSHALKLAYDGEVPTEDSTAEENYRRFYLKNLAPVFRGDYAHLPLRRFPGYFLKSGGGLFAAWEDFAEGRRWVNTNRYRWHSDARAITDHWDEAETENVEVKL